MLEFIARGIVKLIIIDSIEDFLRVLEADPVAVSVFPLSPSMLVMWVTLCLPTKL